MAASPSSTHATDISGMYAITASVVSEFEHPELQGALAYTYAALPVRCLSLDSARSRRAAATASAAIAPPSSRRTSASRRRSRTRSRVATTRKFQRHPGALARRHRLPKPIDKLDPYETPSIGAADAPARSVSHTSTATRSGTSGASAQSARRHVLRLLRLDRSCPRQRVRRLRQQLRFSMYLTMPWLQHHCSRFTRAPARAAPSRDAARSSSAASSIRPSSTRCETSSSRAASRSAAIRRSSRPGAATCCRMPSIDSDHQRRSRIVHHPVLPQPHHGRRVHRLRQRVRRVPGLSLQDGRGRGGLVRPHARLSRRVHVPARLRARPLVRRDRQAVLRRGGPVLRSEHFGFVDRLLRRGRRDGRRRRRRPLGLGGGLGLGRRRHRSRHGDRDRGPRERPGRSGPSAGAAGMMSSLRVSVVAPVSSGPSRPRGGPDAGASVLVKRSYPYLSAMAPRARDDDARDDGPATVARGRRPP